MLKQKGWWKPWFGGKAGYWYPAEKKRKTADRPHPITITLGLLSPVLALVATIISLQSLSTSRQSLRVGQRAYVHVTDGFLHLEKAPNVKGKPSFHLTLGGTVHNSGSTPARFLVLQVVTYEPIAIDKRPSMPAFFSGFISGVPPELAARSEELWRVSGDLQSASQTVTKFIEERTTGQYMAFKASLIFRDVFNETHTTNWCWETTFSSDHPTDCPLVEPEALTDWRKFFNFKSFIDEEVNSHMEHLKEK